MTSLAEVRLWGRTIGAIALAPDEQVATFEYDPAFARSGIQVAPLTMPLPAAQAPAAQRIFRFPDLPPAAFHGLPGLLADALPDRFGNALIDAWLASQGRTPASFNAVERLCYTGRRGMGALEFAPVTGPRATEARSLQIDQLVALASDILSQRQALQVSLDDRRAQSGMRDILRVGTSAGGARAKAVIAWHPETGEVRSGQLDAGEGFEHWLLKFDGVSGNRDRELNDPQGYGLIEYAYSLMARDAGIVMTPCRLLAEGGRQHFMTRRFDRTADGGKLHMQSLCAMAHMDYNAAGAWSYEQALLVMRRLGLSMSEIEQQFRRMVFNIVARNQDDHTKNIAFLMDQSGQWSLSPAFDLTFSYNPQGAWTARHQMSVNGKREDFSLDDLRACAATASMKRGRAGQILEEVAAVLRRWPDYASKAGVPDVWRHHVQQHLRLEMR